jgi:hypothetical protein
MTAREDMPYCLLFYTSVDLQFYVHVESVYITVANDCRMLAYFWVGRCAAYS